MCQTGLASVCQMSWRLMSRNVKTAAADVNNFTDAAVLLLMAHLKETGD